MKSKRLFISITCLLSVLAASGVIAAPLSPETPHKLGTLTPIGGLESSLIEDIVIQGNYAYASFAATLVVIDITDPTNMTRVASLRLGGQIVAIEATADYLYVCSSGGLWIVDISDPLAPEKAGFYPASWSYALAVQDDIAYLSMGSGRLELIDISIPQTPRYVGALFDIGSVYDIEVFGSYAYLAGPDPRVMIVDISNPSQPVNVGVYTPPDSSGNGQIEVSNSTLYYLDSNGFQILDISSPVTPALSGSLYFYNMVSVDLALWGDTAYLATYSCLTECLGGVQIIDVYHPASPTLIGEYSSSELWNIGSISIADGHVFLTHPGDVQSIDVTIPSSPTLVDTLASPLDTPVRFAVSGDYAYIADDKDSETSSLRIADVSNPTQPVIVGQFPTTGQLTDVEVYGNTVILTAIDAWFPAETSRAYFIDVSNPQNPMEIGRFDSLEGNFLGVGILGSYAYLTWVRYYPVIPRILLCGVYVLDITDPANPREVGFFGNGYPLCSTYRDVVFQDNYAYLIGDHLSILDVSDPENPVEVGEQYFEGYVTDVAFSGDYLFLANESGIRVLDNRTPTQPVEISTYERDDFPRELAIQGDLLYAASQTGLFVLNISNPTAPILVATFHSPSRDMRYDVSVDGNDIFFVGSEALLILNLSGSISGVVRNPNRLPVSGVTVAANGMITDITDSRGLYLFESLESGIYDIVPSLHGFTFTPLQQQVFVPPGVVFTFTLLPLPVSVELTPGIATTLTYTDTLGLPTSLFFPSGAVVTSTQVVVTPTMSTDAAGKAFCGHAFEMAAYQGSVVVPELAYSTPVTVSIQYSQADIALVYDKAALELWWWDGAAWQEASQSCSPLTAYQTDPDNDILSVPICQTGIFKLMGPTWQVFIPLIFTYYE